MSIWSSPQGKDVLALYEGGKLTADQAAEALHTSRRSLTQYLAWRDPERRKKHGALTSQGKREGGGPKKNGRSSRPSPRPVIRTSPCDRRLT